LRRIYSHQILKGKIRMRLSIPALLAFAGLSLAAAPASALQLDIIDLQTSQPALSQPEAPSAQPQQSAVPREIVAYTGGQAPGTIIVSTKERRLYFVLPGNQAVRYGVGVGRPGFEWSGTKTVSNKREWPAWTPPAQMLRRRPDLPRHMAGGPDNPLGARAMYLGSSLYRIHGSNEPDTIGQAVSSGCIRMTNEDVMDLYERVKVGTRVTVMR
jgi:lipoprotein-anchoring transpeptidase ErfK/SrfK